MAIKYTYYDYKCPHCGETYKTTFWDLYKVLIVLWTVGFALSWILAIAIMRAVFGSGDMPDVGTLVAFARIAVKGLCPMNTTNGTR